MMSHFCGCNKFMMTIMFFMFIFSFFLGTPVTGREINPLVELSSREDLVQMAGYGEDKLSTVLVSGTLLCHQACLDDQKAPLHPRPVSGALVTVSCQICSKTKKTIKVRGTTDEYGDFLIDLPSRLHSIPNLEKKCLVRVLHLPKDSLCRPAFTGKQTAINLSSVGNGIRTYTAERIHLTPKPSKACTNTRDAKEEMVYA